MKCNRSESNEVKNRPTSYLSAENGIVNKNHEWDLLYDLRFTIEPRTTNHEPRTTRRLAHHS